MKKRVQKLFLAFGITMFAIVLLFIVDKLVLGQKEAETKVNAYEEEHNRYPEITAMKYDWHSGIYIGNKYNYNPDKNLIFDKEYNELWMKYFDEKIELIMTDMNTNLLLEDCKLLTYFDGTDTQIRYDELLINGIYNTQAIEEEKRIEKGAEIIMDIILQLGYNYNFCGVHIDYYDPDGVYQFVIAVDKQNITKEMLMNSVTEVSFDENQEIAEKWEEFYSQRTSFWSFPVDNYEISLIGMEKYGDYQLILSDGKNEKLLMTYSRFETDNPYEEYEYGTFDNILGYSGFYIFKMHHLCYGNFYVIEDGELKCIAKTWGNSLEDCYNVDIDKNGIPELICNVMYGDGAKETIIYTNRSSKILRGCCDELLDVAYDNINYACEYSFYRQDEEIVEIFYWMESTQEFESKKYEIDLDKITFYEFEME